MPMFSMRCAHLALAACCLVLLSPAIHCPDAWAQENTAAERPKGFAGDWQGILKAGPQSLKLVLHLQAKEDNSWSATLDSPDQGAFRIPATSAEGRQNEIQMEWKNLGGKLVAKLSADGQSLEGTWTQGADYEIRLDRVKNNRPQEPLPPFPYIEQEVLVRNRAAGIDLAGTLTVPKGSGPFPAVALITGSGPQNRDEEILGHKIFKVLADHLTRQGVAVLRCDDRGVGASTGNFAGATTVDFASDAEALVEFLKTRPEISASKIGLIGHSEGGTVAAMVAAKSRDVAFIVLMAAAGVNGEQTLYEQSRLILSSNGANQATIEMNEAVQQGIFRIAKSVDDPKEAQNQFEALRAEIETKFKDTLNLDASKLRAWQQSFDADAMRTVSPWFKTFLTLEPKEWLSKVSVPVLAINGELDTQVSAKQHLPAIEAALLAGGNKQFTKLILPKLNHQFQSCATGSPSEYATIAETISPVALEAISGWLLKR